MPSLIICDSHFCHHGGLTTCVIHPHEVVPVRYKLSEGRDCVLVIFLFILQQVPGHRKILINC